MESADPDREHFADENYTVRVGKVQLTLRASEDENARVSDISPQAFTHFTAAEGEVLLHHISETLVRLALAHLPDRDGSPPACPWIEIARRRDFWKIQHEVRDTFVGSVDTEAQRENMRFLFGASAGTDADDVARLDVLADHLRYFAEIYLDNDAYNAAKHGFVMKAELSQISLSIEDRVIIDESGASVAYVHDRTADKSWVLTQRWYSVEATVALGWIATYLIEALWYCARGRYLGKPIPLGYSPRPLRDLLGKPDRSEPRRLVEMSQNLGHYDDSGRTRRDDQRQSGEPGE